MPRDQQRNTAQTAWNGQTQLDTHSGAVPNPGREAPRKKLHLRDTANCARKYADGRCFSTVPGARNYKNKTGKKSLTKYFQIQWN